MKILTRYLFKEIIGYFLMFLAMTVVILMVSQFYDTRSKFLENSPSFAIYLLFMLFTIPEELAQVLPLIALISTMFSYGLLAKNKELLAMVAAGISFRRLAVPAVIFGLGITALLYVFNEKVVPEASRRAKMMEQTDIGGKSAAIFNRRKDLFIKGAGNNFLFIERYIIDRREMIYPTVFEVNQAGGGLSERIEADRATLVSNTPEGSNWEFEGAERWQFNDDGTLRNYQKLQHKFNLQMGPELDRFLSRAKDPSQMNFSELREYRDLLVKKGGENAIPYSISLQQKLSFPIACLLLALLGYSVVVDVHARRFAQGVFAGLLITVLFYVCNALFTSVAKEGKLAPGLASWLPIIGFIVLNYILMLRLNRVRG